MGKAASATNLIRNQQFFKTYFSGKVLDIGAGSDPVVSHAQIFDRAEGDANRILNYLKSESFDCVHIRATASNTCMILNKL